MTVNRLPGHSRRLAPHGYCGLAIMLLAEALLFAGNRTVGVWFTPIMWTAYILFVDALVHRLKGASLLVDNRAEFLIIALVSIASWWLFELYNSPRFWESDLELWWHYRNLLPNPYLRRFGYDWAFATIFPALFETAELFEATLFRRTSGPPIRISRRASYAMIVLGAAAAIIPLAVISEWLVPAVWISYAFLLDPINALMGLPSITGDLSRGRCRRFVSLLASGALCGVLWEFWNYWAISKWTYTVPYLGNVKLFEMPVLGFLGFPPFAVECWAIYVFCKGLLGPKDDIRNRWQAVSAEEYYSIWPQVQAVARTSVCAAPGEQAPGDEL
jgi:hypothetical protein